VLIVAYHQRFHWKTASVRKHKPFTVCVENC